MNMEGGEEVILHAVLTLVMEVSGQLFTPAALTPPSSAHMGLRAWLIVVEKIKVSLPVRN
jgi:hypothetical protein